MLYIIDIYDTAASNKSAVLAGYMAWLGQRIKLVLYTLNPRASHTQCTIRVDRANTTHRLRWWTKRQDGVPAWWLGPNAAIARKASRNLFRVMRLRARRLLACQRTPLFCWWRWIYECFIIFKLILDGAVRFSSSSSLFCCKYCFTVIVLRGQGL